MPIFGAHENLSQEIRHVHYDAEEDTWVPGLLEPRPLLLLSLKVDRAAYSFFRNIVTRPNWNRMVPRGNEVETFFHSYTRSSLDIVTTSTAALLGIRLDSLIPPSDAGMAIFNIARMPLRGTFFGKWTYDDPISRVNRYHHSVVFVADATDDHVSVATAQSLEVRKESTFTRAVTIFIPQNQN